MLGSGSAVIQLLLVVSSIIYSAADDGFGNYALNSITGAFDGEAPNCVGKCVHTDYIVTIKANLAFL